LTSSSIDPIHLKLTEQHTSYVQCPRGWDPPEEAHIVSVQRELNGVKGLENGLLSTDLWNGLSGFVSIRSIRSPNPLIVIRSHHLNAYRISTEATERYLLFQQGPRSLLLGPFCCLVISGSSMLNLTFDRKSARILLVSITLADVTIQPVSLRVGHGAARHSKGQKLSAVIARRRFLPTKQSPSREVEIASAQKACLAMTGESFCPLRMARCAMENSQ